MTRPVGERTTKIPDGSDDPDGRTVPDVFSFPGGPNASEFQEADDGPVLDSDHPIRAALVRPDAPACPTAIIPLQRSKDGGSGAFKILADDGRRYWCKGVDNLQHKRIPINEQIVGRIGKLIGAAVCEVSLIRIPPELDGNWEFRQGHPLRAGYVHGSLAVEPCIETHELSHLNEDDNARRQTSLGVLADLCWAGDTQWLVDTASANRYYSHDHGLYFPGGPYWTAQKLKASRADERARTSDSFPRASEEVLREMADRLATLDALGIAHALAGLPRDWPISDDELVEMVLFLDRRRVAVVQRLRASLSLAKGSAV